MVQLSCWFPESPLTININSTTHLVSLNNQYLYPNMWTKYQLNILFYDGTKILIFIIRIHYLFYQWRMHWQQSFFLTTFSRICPIILTFILDMARWCISSKIPFCGVFTFLPLPLITKAEFSWYFFISILESSFLKNQFTCHFQKNHIFLPIHQNGLCPYRTVEKINELKRLVFVIKFH